MKEKQFLAPWEVEIELNKGREMCGFTTESEKREVNTMIKTVKMNGKFGDKVLMVLDPVYIHIPMWQRKCEIAKARGIGDGYIKYKWDVPKILYWNGKLWCIDGMHRIYGAFLGGLKEVTVEIMLDITMKEAIKYFLDQTDDRKKMSLTDMWNAAIEAEVEEYVTLQRICENNKVCVKGAEFNNEKHVGTFTSIRDGLAMAKNNPEMLDRILKLITKLQWNGNVETIGKAYGAIAFRVLRKLYGYYGENKDQLENILIENCSGASYWNDNLDTKTHSQMFDHLSNVIARSSKLIDITKEFEHSKPTLVENYLGA